MKHLIAAAFRHRRQRFLILFTLFAMVLLTFASQMEIVSLGIITKKGPDFFELFSPIENGKIVKGNAVSRDLFESRWNDLTSSDQLTREDTIQCMTQFKSNDFIQ